MPDTTEQHSGQARYNPASIAKRSKQKVHLCARADKPAMLAHLVKNGGCGKTVVVVNSGADADALQAFLSSATVEAVVMSESDATFFADESATVMIVTDALLQSTRPENLPCIVSYDLPDEPEDYLARLSCLGENGLASAFVSADESSRLYAVERVVKRAIPQEPLAGFVSETYKDKTPKAKRPAGPKPEKRGEKRKGASQHPLGRDKDKKSGGAPKQKRPVRRISLEDQKKKPSN